MVGPNQHWWSTRTPEGTGTIQLNRKSRMELDVTAWRDGSHWLINQIPKLLGSEDDLSNFHPTGKVRELWIQNRFKLGRTDILWDALVGSIFGQKVQATKAVQSRKRLARKFGVIAPGPQKTWILPSPLVVGEMGYYDFHKLGVERKRAETLIRVAQQMPRLQKNLVNDTEKLLQRLLAIKGIGEWTVGLVKAAVIGDPDSVPLGDFHFPNTVCWHLAKEPRGDDKRMLELLEPYKGHRWRIIKILKSAGSAPKYGPRLSLIHDGMTKGNRNRRL